ncbi:MAG TPA: response regulator [Bacillota bacterium]|nr:response regulator [Bacillota bacterium]
MKKVRPILEIENDSNDIAFLQAAFEEAQTLNPIHVVRDGQEAIDYLAHLSQCTDRNRYPLPGLILLDLTLPSKSGLEVLQWLRQQSGLPLLPVIVLSASLQESDVLRCYQLGANSFVAKPVSMAERARLARAIKEFWLHFHQLPPDIPGVPA